MTTPIRRQLVAFILLLLLINTQSLAQDTRAFNQNSSRSNNSLKAFNQNASRSNHTRLSFSFSPTYSSSVNTSNDSLLFRGSGGGLRFGADYFFGKAGIGISSGFGSSSADDATINSFLKNVSIPQDQLAITKSNQQNMYLLLGPSIQFGNKVQLYAHAKGGLFINNGGLVSIQQRGAQRAAYRNESTGRNVYPGFQTGLNFQYSFKSDVWSLGIGADYMGTKTEVMNYDARRGGGVEGLKLSRNISDVVAGISIRYNIRSPRDAASGLATGKRSSRDAASGLSTGRRVLPTVNKREISPRDAASGLPTGKRVLPTVNKRESSALPRDAASGRASGKRSNMTDPEDATSESCGPVTRTITHPDGTKEEMTFSCPNDALAYEEGTGDYTEQPTWSSSNQARTISNAPGTRGRGIISGRLTWPNVGNTGIITNAIINNNPNRSGSATLNSQTSASRTTQQNSFGSLVRISARDAASGLATGKRSSRDAASGLATGKRSSRDAASGLATGKRSSRDAASGLATGRRQYEPVFIEGQGEVCNPCLAKTSMANAQSNPLYTDKGMSGNNPLYNGRTAGADNDCDGLAGMSVSLVEINTGVIMAKTITEPCGDFFFANVPEGEYIVKVSGSFVARKSYDVSVQSKTDLLGAVEEADQSVQLLLNTEQGNENDGMQQKAGISTSRSNIRCKSLAIIEADLDGDGEYESLRATATFSDGSSQDVTSAARSISNAAGSKGIVLEAAAMQMERRRVEVLKSNKQGDPNANRLSTISIKNTSGKLTATGTFSDGSTRDITDNIEMNTAHSGVKQYSITLADSDDDGIADAVIKTKTKSNQSNDRIAASDLETEEMESSNSNIKILSIATGDVDGDGLSEMLIGGALPGGQVISAAMRPGNPIGGLTIKGGKNPGGNLRTIQTDDNGEFEFTDLEAGDYTFTVEQTVIIDDETPVVLGNRSRTQDHNSSRSNKSASFIANNPDNNNSNSNRAQDHNSSRSNKTASKAAEDQDNSNNKVQDHNSSRSNKTASKIAEDPDNNDGDRKTNIGPVKWMAPESTQRAISSSHSNIKNMLTSLDELDQQLNADQNNARAIINTSRSNIKSQRAAVNDLQQTLDNLQTKDKEDALRELDQKMSAVNAQFSTLIESVQKMGTRYTSISNVLKTKHDTAKNSIGNIR